MSQDAPSFAEWADLDPDCEQLYACDYIAEHAVPKYGCVMHLTVGVLQLSETIMMTDAARWDIPELGVTQESFAHAGYRGSVAGLLVKVAKNVDMMRSGYPPEQQPAFDRFLESIDCLLHQTEESVSCPACKLQIRDPSGLSTVSGTAPVSWARLESFDRSFQENDDLGIISKEYRIVESSEKMNSPNQVAELVLKATRVACLSGAGISVESGIPPFRSNTGDSIWGSFSADRMTVQGFNTSEEVVKYWWNMKHSLLPRVNVANPNSAHLFFGYLESVGKMGTIITQNIDSLHQKGGVSSENVIELHGHMRGLICSDNVSSKYNPLPYRAGQCTYSMSEAEAISKQFCAGDDMPLCPLCSSPLRTETVMFNQPLPPGSFTAAVQAVSTSDLLFVIGTSLIVEPANSLPTVALRLGIPIVMINLDDSQFDDYATSLIRSPAGAFLSQVQDIVQQKLLVAETDGDKSNPVITSDLISS